MDYFFTDSFEDLNVQARERYGSIYENWCALDQSLAKLRGDPKGHSYYHLDANWDIILRCVEDEQQEIFTAAGTYRGASTLFLQISLSKWWLFSIYELLRASTAEGLCSPSLNCKGYCKRPDCFNCQVLETKQELNHFRIPAAKFERALVKDSANYHSQLVFENEGGSVGWKTENYMSRVNGVDIVSRRELSDFVIERLIRT